MNQTTFPSALDVGGVIGTKRENVRTILAVVVILLLVGLVAALVAYVWVNGNADNAQLLLTGVFTPVVGIVGTVLGFYFGAETQKSS